MFRAPFRCLAAVMVTAVSLATAGFSAAEDFGLTVEWGPDTRLHRMELATAEIDEIAILPSFNLVAMDRGPDGRVYGLDVQGIVDPARLIAIQPETGAASVIGELSIADPTGLAFGPAGQLWVVGGQSLHRIDRATGATLEILTLDQELRTLAGSATELYGFSGFWHLWTIDTSDGQLTSVAELSPIFLDRFDADFDSAGNLWILGGGTGPIMGIISTGLYQIPDPPTGVAIEIFFQFYNIGDPDPRSRLSGLAVIPVVATVEIPTLDGVGVAVLAVLLAVLGAVALSRMRRTAAAP